MKRAAALITLVVLLTMPLSEVFSEEYPLTVDVDEAHNRITFKSSVLTVEVEGKSPILKFYYAGNELGQTHLRLSLEKIVEFTGEYEVAQEVEVGNWTWAQSEPYPIMTEDGLEVGKGVHLTLFRRYGFPFLLAFAELSMYYANFTETRTWRNTNVTTTTMGGVELRVAIHVVEWAFKNPDTGRLALVFKVEKEIPGETTEPHSIRLEEDADETTIYLVGENTGVEEGFVKWSSQALISNSAVHRTPVEAAIVNETRSEATLILSYDCVHEGIADLSEQSLTVGVVEENIGYVLHPKPPILTPEVVFIAGAIVSIVLVVMIVRWRRKDLKTKETLTKRTRLKKARRLT